MHEYWHVILHALIDTAKILPFLFIVYYLIELLEYKWSVKIQNNRLLKGKVSPVFGSVIGCIPQCGFSVVSTDLFSKKAISVGALVAVYIATSDEALPLMIAKPDSIPYMVGLVAIKMVLGVLVGYLATWMYKLIFKQKVAVENHHHDHDHEHEENVVHGGCCKHNVESNSFDWLHPMLHCVKIALFIFIINVLFGFLTDVWVGEENLKNFLSASLWVQPLLAVLIGLIPNCASSVVITELFLIGGLSFGALVAGLCVNAGLGFVVLFKQNKNWKENLFVLLVTIIPSLIVGYILLLF